MKRFYFTLNLSASITPTFNAVWTHINSNRFRQLLLAPTGSSLTNGTVITVSASGQTALDRTYVSPPLYGAQTIAGSVKAQLRVFESATNDNVVPRSEIYVVDATGTTVRGTLLSIGRNTPTWSEPNATTLRNLTFISSSLTGVVCQDQDRIVVKLGYSDDGAGSSIAATTNWGDPINVRELPEDNTTFTALCPWIEFSQDLVFNPEPTWGIDPNITGTLTMSGSTDRVIRIRDVVTGTVNLSASIHREALFFNPDPTLGKAALEFNGAIGANRDAYYLIPEMSKYTSRCSRTVMIECLPSGTFGSIAAVTNPWEVQCAFGDGATGESYNGIAFQETTGSFTSIAWIYGADFQTTGSSRVEIPSTKGSWHQVAMRYGAQKLGIQMDGVSKDIKVGDTSTPPQAPIGRFLYGQGFQTVLNGWQGRLGRCYVFNRVLNDAELAVAWARYFPGVAAQSTGGYVWFYIMD
jgi:hypothetical protein